jgi:hypothetical protein
MFRLVGSRCGEQCGLAMRKVPFPGRRERRYRRKDARECLFTRGREALRGGVKASPASHEFFLSVLLPRCLGDGSVRRREFHRGAAPGDGPAVKSDRLRVDATGIGASATESKGGGVIARALARGITPWPDHSTDLCGIKRPDRVANTRQSQRAELFSTEFRRFS